VERLQAQDGGYRLLLEPGVEPADVLKSLVDLPGLRVDRFEQVQMSLDEIFVRVVGRAEAQELA
jgi:ABC-type uncharacterized transport system ATPase subunit